MNGRLGIVGWVSMVIVLSVATLSAAESPTTEPAKKIAGLVKILTSDDTPHDSRRIAAELLMDIQTATAFGELSKILDDSADHPAQLAVIAAIAGRDAPDERFIEPLIVLLLGTDLEIQRASAGAIGRYRERAPVAHLAEIASAEKRPLPQKLAAIGALGKTRSKASVEALITLMGTVHKNRRTTKQIKLACAKSLKELTRVDYRTDLAAWQGWWDQNKAKTDVQWFQDQSDILINENATLADLLKRTEQALIDTTVQLAAQKAPAERVKTIQAYLAGDLPALRRASLRIVSDAIDKGQLPPAELLPALRALLADADPTVRRESARVLSEAGDTAAVPHVLKQLENEVESEIKQQLLVALGRLGTAELLPKIIVYLHSPLESVAIGAATAMGRLVQDNSVSQDLKDQAVDAILKRYQQANADQPALKEELLRGMIALADGRFKPVFEASLASRDSNLRRYGAQGIAALKDPESVSLLLNYLGDPEYGVRAEIATQTARLTDAPEAVAQLVERLNPNVENDTSVRDVMWDAVAAMVKRWPVAQQLAWAERLVQRATWLDETHRRKLTAVLIEQVESESPAWNVNRRIKLFTQLGTLMLRASQPADAIRYLRQALVAGKQDAAVSVDKLANDLARQMLAAAPASTRPVVAAEFLTGVAGLLVAQQVRTLTDTLTTALGEADQVRQFRSKLPDSFKKKYQLPATQSATTTQKTGK